MWQRAGGGANLSVDGSGQVQVAFFWKAHFAIDTERTMRCRRRRLIHGDGVVGGFRRGVVGTTNSVCTVVRDGALAPCPADGPDEGKDQKECGNHRGRCVAAICATILVMEGWYMLC